MAQASPSKDLAVTPDIHHTNPHQRPATPLGILGHFPREVRNHVYRDIFDGEIAIPMLQWRQRQSSNRPKHFFGILTASKTTRTEAEPFFYLYCRFSFDVKFSQDQSQFTLAKWTQHLQRKLPRLPNIVFEAVPFETNEVIHDLLYDQVAFLPREPHAPDACGLMFPDIFEDPCFNGREMVFSLIFNVERFWAFRNRITVSALQAVFIPFQRYEVVKFSLQIRALQNSPVGRIGLMVVAVEFAQESVKRILGPCTKTDTLEQTEAHVYADCVEFHPKSHFEAMAKGEGLE